MNERFDELADKIIKRPTCIKDPELLEEIRAATGIHGESLLHFLAVEGYRDAVEQLALVSDVDSTNRFGQTALMDCVTTADMEMVSALLAVGANPNKRDRNGSTALHYAYEYNKGLDIVEILIRHGADDKVVNNFGMLPAEMR